MKALDNTKSISEKYTTNEYFGKILRKYHDDSYYEQKF